MYHIDVQAIIFLYILLLNFQNGGGEALLNASKLTSVAIAKETALSGLTGLTPMGSKYGKTSQLKNKDLNEGMTNDRIQNYLNTLQPNGTSLIDGPLRFDFF